jgi:hypothetical protein
MWSSLLFSVCHTFLSHCQLTLSAVLSTYPYHISKTFEVHFHNVLVFHFLVNRWRSCAHLCISLTEEWNIFISIHQITSKNNTILQKRGVAPHLNVIARAGWVPFKWSLLFSIGLFPFLSLHSEYDFDRFSVSPFTYASCYLTSHS